LALVLVPLELGTIDVRTILKMSRKELELKSNADLVIGSILSIASKMKPYFPSNVLGRSKLLRYRNGQFLVQLACPLEQGTIVFHTILKMSSMELVLSYKLDQVTG
jgi:hypothetical protein